MDYRQCREHRPSLDTKIRMYPAVALLGVCPDFVNMIVSAVVGNVLGAA